MAVQFILGRSGTGKTSYCVRAIVDALLDPCDQRLIFLVPEQATYQAERAILADKRIPGYNRLHVLSFDRLQFLVLGKNIARPAISRVGRQMIVHRILRDSSDRLQVFRSSAPLPGFARQMAQTITELHQYAKTPEDIDRLVVSLRQDERKTMTAMKLADIGIILREYIEFVEGRFIDPDLQLMNACRAVREADFVKGARLWVDGFAGFTASELALLAELLKVAAHTQIALCLDSCSIDLTDPQPQADGPAGLFDPTQRTYAALLELINKAGLKLAKPIILNQPVRFSDCAPLAHVERNIFELDTPKSKAQDNLHIIAAPNQRCEVRFVASRILKLVKEKHYRYRDIAVIASDIDSYEHYIRAYFDDYGIPFFIDKRKPLSQHPLAQLICSALQTVVGGFAHSDIFTYLKTDLVRMNRSDIDVLENYCLAFGITPDDWTSTRPWRFATDDQADFDERLIDQIRRQAVEPLLEIQNGLCPADSPDRMLSPEEFTRIVFTFLDVLDVRRTIREWIERAAQAGDHAAADEHRQFFDRFVDIFDELVEAFAGQTLSAPDYLEVIKTALSQLTLAFIPPSLDQVLVGSIERSRHPDLKAAFLIGATQKQFPVPLGSNTILTDDDRVAAESEDFHLAPAANQVLAERRYLAYISFTRPCEFLFITYPCVDDRGGAVARSHFVDQLQALFDDLHEQTDVLDQTDIADMQTQTDLADLLCSRLGRDILAPQSNQTNKLSELLEDICSDADLANLGSSVLSAINYNNQAELDTDTVSQLFGSLIRSSASRLGTFAACPYQYFARYTLELKERKEFKLEPIDLGNFYHRVLDALHKRLKAEGHNFAGVQDDRLLAVLSEQIERTAAGNAFFSAFMRRSAHNAFIIQSASEILGDCVLEIARMVRAGNFRPLVSEVLFGDEKNARETLGEYEIALPDGRRLSLGGKIDRLDIAEVAGKKLALIFDYKRRDESFNWSDFYYGLDIQLPLYMLAVLNVAAFKIDRVAGAFYVPVETKIGGASFDELSAKAEKFTRKAKGLFNGEYWQQLDPNASGDSDFYSFFVTKEGKPYGYYAGKAALEPADFQSVLGFTEAKIVQLAEEIVSGRIGVSPYRLSGKSPCAYCEYGSLCRFDWQINDYNPLQLLGKPDVLKIMQNR